MAKRSKKKRKMLEDLNDNATTEFIDEQIADLLSLIEFIESKYSVELIGTRAEISRVYDDSKKFNFNKGQILYIFSAWKKNIIDRYANGKPEDIITINKDEIAYSFNDHSSKVDKLEEKWVHELCSNFPNVDFESSILCYIEKRNIQENICVCIKDKASDKAISFLFHDEDKSSRMQWVNDFNLMLMKLSEDTELTKKEGKNSLMLNGIFIYEDDSTLYYLPYLSEFFIKSKNNNVEIIVEP